MPLRSGYAPCVKHLIRMHRGGKKQAPVNSQQPAPVNSHQPAPVVPQQLAPPPNAVPVSVAQAMRPVWNYSSSPWPAMQSQQMSATYFNHPPQMQLTGNPPQLQVLQQSQPVQQSRSSEPIPHHTLIGATSVPGISNQVVSFNAQNQHANLPASEYFNEVFQCDPHMFSVFQQNPQQVNIFKPRHYFQTSMLALTQHL